ncbi:hypothetical protein QWZ16_08280 [Vibrio ostreicida]|uniref:Uncharacterized protein n=1 Tax=Vibrio ostreicida TaxID=526588 RepID=A0ABT8BUF2_9VIBR|nr:hypothetical protein [Vibrio ostreicida]MDN3609698.1 hypothetical protein [Vibrio ostreicida]
MCNRDMIDCVQLFSSTEKGCRINARNIMNVSNDLSVSRLFMIDYEVHTFAKVLAIGRYGVIILK